MTGRELIRAGVVLVALLAAAATAAGLARADEIDKRLFQLQLKLAQGGDPNAQYYLGEMYEQGLGTEVNLEEAFKWYAKAAEKGHPYAKRKLAMRKQIEAEHERERSVLEALRTSTAATAEQKPAPAPAAVAAPSPAAQKKAPAKVQMAEKPAETSPAAEEERARLEEARARAEAEREKKRQAVRRMLLEMQKTWKGEAFE
jgi:TPR repeat protein